MEVVSNVLHYLGDYEAIIMLGFIFGFFLAIKFGNRFFEEPLSYLAGASINGVIATALVQFILWLMPNQLWFIVSLSILASMFHTQMKSLYGEKKRNCPKNIN